METLNTENYRIVFDGQDIKSINLNTQEIFDEDYFKSIKLENALEQDFNLLLNTWDLLDRINFKGKTNQTKMKLKELEKHIGKLVDMHMGRS